MIQLPEQIIKAAHKNPRTTLVYSKPKAGKTTIMSQLPNSLIIDTEDGAPFVDALKISVNNFNDLREVAEAIYLKGFKNNVYTPPYEFLIIDTLTRIDEWSELEGTWKYMDKPQGKSFNRIGGKKDGEKITNPNHPDFETVHEIGQGYGYRYSREAVLRFFDSFNTLAPHIIYNCHVKDKFVGVSTTGNEVMTKEINLTGKLKDIIASKVDTIAFFSKEGDKGYLSFTGDEGTRSPHLSNKKILISEKLADGKIVTYWDKIFLK